MSRKTEEIEEMENYEHEDLDKNYKCFTLKYLPKMNYITNRTV